MTEIKNRYPIPDGMADQLDDATINEELANTIVTANIDLTDVMIRRAHSYKRASILSRKIAWRMFFDAYPEAEASMKTWHADQARGVVYSDE